MHSLRVQAPGTPPQLFGLAKLRTTIGRSPRADVPLSDPFASRLHAEVRSEGDAIWVADLGSANGTYVNEHLVTMPRRLAPGDLVRIGETTIALTEPDAASGTWEGMRREVTAGSTIAPRSTTVVTTGLAEILASVERAAGAELARPERRRDLLEVVSKVGVALLSSASLDEVLQQILDLVFEALPAERGYLLLVDGASGEPSVRASSSSRGNGAPTEVAISRTIQAEVLGQGRSVLTSDAQDDQRFRDRESVVLSGIRSVMAVPLSTFDKPFGLIYVDNPLRVRMFTDDDLRLLTTIASVAAVKVEHAILLDEHFENERLKLQLNGARAIQQRLLPCEPPTLPGYELSGISFSCYEVGGDYFDLMLLDDGSLVLGVGDVSGKGLDAALLMSSLHASVRARAERGATPGELVRGVNRYLCDTTPYNKFATLFCGRLDPADHHLRYVSAGHAPAVLVRSSGETATLPATCPPVGLLEESSPQESELEIGPGDLLLIYTDGLTEAENAEGSQFGTDRLCAVLSEQREQPIHRLRDAIDESLHRFTGGGALGDDLTLVFVKRSPADGASVST